ncbi:hypothetical protein TNCV_4114851 [Trichonephila clavipes]|nr:hypothetical protein TNCV_4114851 [Trichonephila clavipes]
MNLCGTRTPAPPCFNIEVKVFCRGDVNWPQKRSPQNVLVVNWSIAIDVMLTPELEQPFYTSLKVTTEDLGTATTGSDVVQSGRPILDDFFQHLWPYIGNNTANVVFQMVKRLWLSA